MSCSLALAAAIPTWAGSWVKDAKGWWYQNDDGSWPAGTWQWIDGNGDGTAECYRFDKTGYMFANQTTPDGYQVNADGAWTENGVVQTKQVSGTAAATDPMDYSQMSAAQAKAYYNVMKQLIGNQSDPNNYSTNENLYDLMTLMDINGDGIIELCASNERHSYEAKRGIYCYTYDPSAGKASYLGKIGDDHTSGLGIGNDGIAYQEFAGAGACGIIQVKWNSQTNTFDQTWIYQNDNLGEADWEAEEAAADQIGIRYPQSYHREEALELLESLSQ